MGIDLNTIEEEEEEPEQPAYHAASPPAATPVDRALQVTPVCLELWHACAGPRIWLPKKGSLVVYFPQGHIEHFGEDGGRRGGVCRRDVPPHVFCLVVDVKLHADAATDEVYAQLSLLAESEEFELRMKKGEVEGNEEDEDVECISRSSVPHMFCKTLTASDTSTHGGFSVPRRAAEDCFPPLDYKLQRPSQELIAKDLHGTEWTFRHIYRGQPRRHLLTTGWSAFVNRKKLISGDAVLFLRGNDGELRLGVRRAAQFKSGSPVSAHPSRNMNLATLTIIANSVSARKVFHIYYNPRATSSKFIVPYWKFLKSFNHLISVGMRFRMIYESDDATERRSTGLITGISDIDPIRWPHSKWRCLLVNWDNDVDANQQKRISPWEIEPIGPVIGSGSSTTAGLKRAKITLPSVNMDFPIPNGNGCPDLRESASFHEVLQGQEVTRLTPPICVGVAASHFSENSGIKGKSADANNSIIGEFIPGSRVRVPHGKSDFSFNCTGFSESVGFQKVLQGQEVFSKVPPFLGAGSDAHGRYGVYGLFDGLHAYHTQSRLPAASLGYVTLVQQSLPSIQAFPPSSVLMFQEASSKNLLFQPMHSMNCQDRGDNECYSAKLDGSKTKTLHREEANSPFWPATGRHFTNQQHKMVKVYAPVLAGKSDLENDKSASRKGFRLFGFSLTEKIPVTNLVDPPPPVSQTKTDVKADIAFSTSMPQMCPLC
ncbi:auxin response factor 2 [Musa acuminata AAA Group]|uniref:auxin response factor 2 n=1 Tax=Musa acuminata AAA Group TaxID=214697 RepID=UPI0031E39370